MAKPAEKPGGPSARVLIVDDNEDIVVVTRRILERQDYEILTAADGASALEIARERRPDLILLDIMLPGMDGLQVCRALKGDPETRKVMIILVTGRGSTNNLVEGLEAGADDYITKPFHLTELTARVRSALRIKQLNDEVEARGRALLETQRERLKAEKMATIGTLATGIAHEFNNIMSGIAGFAQVARKDPAYKDRLIDVATNQAARALQITRSLATFYRPRLESSSADVVAEIENALCLLTKRVNDKEIDLVLELDDVPAVIGQSGQLQEVFLNLVLNATQAVEQRGRIVVRAREAEGGSGPCVLVEVEDDGCGIPADDIEHVFSPFFTTKGALGGGVEGGSGLGLSVSYNIVQSYGGKIAVRSEPGKGSIFSVLLRVAPECFDIGAGDSARRPRVVIGDPDDSTRELVEEYLKSCTVSSCERWEKVRAALEEGELDLLVLDMAIDGDVAEHIDSARAIREDVHVLLTSDENSAAFRAASAKADQTLFKPYSIESITNVVNSALTWPCVRAV